MSENIEWGPAIAVDDPARSGTGPFRRPHRSPQS